MNTVHVLYYCGCWERHRVDLARNTACQRHGIDAQKVNTHEWRVRCPDCRYGRWCGQDKGDALRRQRDHCARYPLHAPSVAYDRVTYDGSGSVLRWDGKRSRNGPAIPAEGATMNDRGTDRAPPF